MSSSTSTSDAAAPGDLRRLLLYLGVFFTCLAAAGVVNYAVDPYGFFHEDAARLGAFRGKNLALLAMIEVAKLPVRERRAADVVVIGDSRARWLAPADGEGRLLRSDEHTVLNLGIGGASFEEAVTFLNDEKSKLKGMRLLIFTLPFERLAAKALPDRCAEVRAIANSRARYLLNRDLLKQSVQSLVAARQRSGQTRRVAPDASSRDAQVRAEWARMFQSYDATRADARLAVAREMVAALAARGVKVVFWSPPVREDIQALIRGPQCERNRQHCLRAMEHIAPVVDMTGSHGVGGTEFTFVDPVHTTNGPAILRELIGAM